MEIPNPDWTVNNTGIKSILQAAQALGANTESLLQSAGIDSAGLSSADNRYPVASLLHLYELAAEVTATPDLGIYSGRIAYLNGLNLQLYMSTICDTFREYLNLMPSVLSFAGDIGEVLVRREGAFIRLEWVPLWDATRKQRWLSDELLSTSVYIVNSLCVQPIKVVKAHFTYPEPEDLSQLKAVFGEKLAFNQPQSCLYYHKSCLNYPLTKLFSDWNQVLSQSVQHLFPNEVPADRFMLELHDTLLRLLPTGTMNIDAVAAALKLSRRTLQRRLRDKDTQFAQVLQKMRAGLALKYLEDARLSVTDIALLLGYSDLPSFSIAFKSWHGLSPREYRQR